MNGEAFAGRHFLLASAQEELKLFKLLHHPDDCQAWPSSKPHGNDPAATRHRSRMPARGHVCWPRSSSGEEGAEEWQATPQASMATYLMV